MQQKFCLTCGQGWVIIFGWRATMETKLVYAGQYKYRMELIDLNFERKKAFISPFSKKSISRGIFNV